MKTLKKADIIILAVLAVIFAGIVITVVHGNRAPAGDPGTEQPAENVIPVEDRPFSYYANDKKIGALTGGLYELMILERFPDAEILRFNNQPDMAVALNAGTIDAFTCPRSSAEDFMREDSSLTCLKEVFMEIPYGFAFQKSAEQEPLRDRMNAFLQKLRSEGTYDEIVSCWFGSDESKKAVDLSGLSGENGTLRYVTASTMQPFSYIANGQNVGLEVDLVARFCREYGYALEISNAEFASLITGITSGVYDIASGTIMITPERAESVNFSEVYYTADAVAVVRKEAAAAGGEPSYAAYNGKRLGILTSSSFEAVTFEKFPNSEYLYFNTGADLATALTEGEIDAFISDEPNLRLLAANNPKITYLKTILAEDEYAFCFTKNNEKTSKYREQFNEMIAEFFADGTMDEVNDIWLGADESRKVIDLSGLTGERLLIAVVDAYEPFSYIKDNQLVGHSVDLVVRFCRKYGYTPQFEEVDIPSFLAGAATGKYDICAGAVSPTEERKETIDFSDTFYYGGMALAVRKDDISSSSAPHAQINSLEQLNDPQYTVGYDLGASGMFAVEEHLPKAKGAPYDSHITGYEAVRQGKIDAYVFERMQMDIAIKSGFTGVRLLDENLGESIPIAIGISRSAHIPNLTEQLNTFIAKLQDDGTLDEMYTRWVFDHNYDQPVIPKPTAPTQKIVVGTTGIVEPYSFYIGEKLAGYDIELVERFLSEINAEVEYRIYDYSGIIAAAESGEIDCIFANLNITAERQEVIDFSDPLYIMDNGVMVADIQAEAAADTEVSWLESIRLSFERNFIRENRWKLIVQGIGTTCLITVMTVIFGSLLAFLICLFRRLDSVLAKGIANLYVKLMQGTPMVVLLMIMYYVIFRKSGLSAISVAIVGFSLNFAAYVSEMLHSGIESIDSGQREAALALGYSESQAFFRFIFPQAAIRQLPVYRGEIISMMKTTSIVGYIAIQDLTKMSDIIRSRTYEAFFPLIVTALIYFILAWIISVILKQILIRTNPKTKKRTVKGVTTK